MDTVIIIAGVFALYCVGCYLLYRYRQSNTAAKERFEQWGPIVMIRFYCVGFLDAFIPLRRVLRAYGTLGIIFVVIIAALMVVSIGIAAYASIVNPPAAEGIYEPQNMLLLPGINEFVPSTVAVWAALVICIVAHELGHGILCRVENVKVKSTGILMALIPIGFFIEPDETDLENSGSWAKARVHGAGIMNNMVVGIGCFILAVLLIGMAVPIAAPSVDGIYQNSAAEKAGLPVGSEIIAINGQSIINHADISTYMSSTQPGDTAIITLKHDGVVKEYSVVLDAAPNSTRGYLGIYSITPEQRATIFESMKSPVGFLEFMILPFDTSAVGRVIRVIGYDEGTEDYQSPFPLYWGMIHLLFWSGWISFNLGIFNAIPMVPLDGGNILKEGTDSILKPRGREKLSKDIVTGFSVIVFTCLIAVVAAPYIF